MTGDPLSWVGMALSEGNSHITLVDHESEDAARQFARQLPRTAILS